MAATFLRFGGLCASLIGTYTNFSVIPIYVSAAMWILVGVVSFGLPFETHGRSAVGGMEGFIVTKAKMLIRKEMR